jgi:hypothetical protein
LKDASNPKRTKTPKAARPTNAPTIVQNENVGTENPNDEDEGKNMRIFRRATS